MRLFIEGHNVKHGYAISKCYTDPEIMVHCERVEQGNDQPDTGEPLKFIKSRERAKELVSRYNRRFATH